MVTHKILTSAVAAAWDPSLGLESVKLMVTSSTATSALNVAESFLLKFWLYVRVSSAPPSIWEFRNHTHRWPPYALLGCIYPVFPLHPHETLQRTAPSRFQLPHGEFWNPWPTNVDGFSSCRMILSCYRKPKATQEHNMGFDRNWLIRPDPLALGAWFYYLLFTNSVPHAWFFENSDRGAESEL